MLSPRLTDPDVLQVLLARAGVSPQRSAGQNFLISDEVVEATLEVLSAAPKQITELGAGMGTLTVALAAQGFSVRAIERDKTLAEILWDQLPKKLRGQVELTVDDLRNVNWAQPSHKASAGDEAYCLIGNIPYNLSGLIIRRLTQLAPAPELALFLVQCELAERLTAAPPQMSLLGLSAQLWGVPRIVLQVPANCFWPEPEVDSSLVLIPARAEAAQTAEEREDILHLAKQLFQTKRKQVGGRLAKLTGKPAADIATMLAGVGLTPQTRPQEIGVQQWRALTRIVRDQGLEIPALREYTND